MIDKRGRSEVKGTHFAAGRVCWFVEKDWKHPVRTGYGREKAEERQAVGESGVRLLRSGTWRQEDISAVQLQKVTLVGRYQSRFCG